MEKITLLYEDEDCICVIKPPGMPVQPDKTGDEDLFTYLCSIRKQVYLIHRLDRPVGGLMLFAKKKQSAALLSHTSDFAKEYLAVLCGFPANKKGRLEDYLMKNGRTNLSYVVPSNTKNAKKAILDYEVISEVQAENQTLSLVKISLVTGRHHQIRVQFSHAGCALWGDKKYNPSFKIGNTLPALWAYRICFFHCKTGKKMSFQQKTQQYPFSLF